MSSEVVPALEKRIQELFVLIDSLDFDRLGDYLADDVRAVDELSGGWRRGLSAYTDYFEQLQEMVESVESRLDGMDTTTWDDVGVVTFELNQRYRMGGEDHQIRAPTSVVLRRYGETWRIVLIHSVPLAEQER
jgi:ketosteroid isomerase-like protein